MWRSRGESSLIKRNYSPLVTCAPKASANEKADVSGDPGLQVHDWPDLVQVCRNLNPEKCSGGVGEVPAQGPRWDFRGAGVLWRVLWRVLGKVLGRVLGKVLTRALVLPSTFPSTLPSALLSTPPLAGTSQAPPQALFRVQGFGTPVAGQANRSYRVWPALWRSAKTPATKVVKTVRGTIARRLRLSQGRSIPLMGPSFPLTGSSAPFPVPSVPSTGIFQKLN